MRIQVLDLPYEWPFVELYSVNDLHIGDILFNHVKFYEFTQMILAEPYRFIAVNGDILNNNLKNSAGSAFEDIISPNDQKKEAKRMLMPLRERIACMNGGNHEERTKREAGMDVTEEIAESLGVPYNEDHNLLKVCVGKRPNGKKQVYTVYITHGSGGGKKPGSALNNIEELSKNILADVYIMSHVHKRIGHRAVFQEPDLRNGNIIYREQLYVISAGWLDYGGYPVQKMMRPQVRGANPVKLYGTEKRTELTI